MRKGANVNARTVFYILVSAEDAWKQTKWVHRHIWQAKHKKPQKNINIQYCILYVFHKHLADAGPKNGKRLIAVSLCKAE